MWKDLFTHSYYEGLIKSELLTVRAAVLVKEVKFTPNAC